MPSRRSRADVAVSFMFEGASCTVRGDIAWGGNWFFLASDHGLDLSLANLDRLTAFSWAIRQSLESSGIRGDDGGVIDHVELFGPPSSDDCDSRNFVLCPGKAYDRSPCGTGTSAKLACLAADGELEEGEDWVQEGILGSAFRGTFRWADRAAGTVLPVVTGTAFVTAEATLILGESDPLRWGIRVDPDA